MIMTIIQTTTDTTAPENNPSGQVEEPESAEIKAAELKVRDAEASVWWANRIAITLLILYAALAAGIVLSSLWTTRANERLRNAERLLNNL
ncbi:MAG TPA: hypothetical protein VIS78_07015, partial [Blastocatellia bacterium]